MDKLLDWWAERLRRDCRVDPVWGYFVDQRWFDLVAGFFSDLAIVSDPEYNVAYWNLHNRQLEHAAGRYLVNGRPLAFFHFSGFDPARAAGAQPPPGPGRRRGDPVLERMLAEYAADLDAAGHAESRMWPYTYAALADGTRVRRDLRGLYDDFAAEHDGAGRRRRSHRGHAGLRTIGSRNRRLAAPPGVNRVAGPCL